MSSDAKRILIKTTDVTKTYRVWRTPSQRLLALMLELLLLIAPNSKRIKKWLHLTYTTVEALKETSLTLRSGEAVGIIGRNGAGKSTLLQMITGSLTPSSGTIERNGRIAALLELGSGFDSECTGVDNVRLNASILGLNDKEIESKFDSILEYADIGDFVYQPVKTYSSGMRMRLAFAVAAHVEADVIIIDEALGVGDARFQLKCAKTIEGHLKRGSSLLFVSHNMNAVKQLCASAVLLHEGEMLMEGRPNEVANIYSRITAGDSLVKVKKQIEELESNEFEIAETLSVSVDQVVGIEVGSEFKYSGLGIDDLKQRLSNFCLVGGESRFKLLEEWSLKPPESSGNEFSYGGELGRIENIRISDIKGHERLVHTTGDRFDVSFDVVSYDYFLEPIFAITFKDVKGQELYVYNTLFAGVAIGSISKGERRRVQFSQSMNLMQGEYFISLGFVTFVGEELLVINRRYDVVKVQVLPLDKCTGLANMYTQTRVDTINE